MTKKTTEFDWWPVWDPNEMWESGRRAPAHVPVLSAENIKRGKMGSNDCRCLLNWVAGFPMGNVRRRMEAMLLENIELRGVEESEGMDAFNDSRSAEESAEVWNETMREAGYTEAV